MNNRIDLFGIKELTTESAKECLGRAIMGVRERRLVEEAIDQDVKNPNIQALVYTIGNGVNVMPIRNMINQDCDIYGRPLIGYEKRIGSLNILVDEEMSRDIDTEFLRDERYDSSGILRQLIRGGHYEDLFMISINPDKPDTKVIFKSNYNLERTLDKENVFEKGPVTSLLRSGCVHIPVFDITEISSVLHNVTYDVNGKHTCRYSLEDLSM